MKGGNGMSEYERRVEHIYRTTARGYAALGVVWLLSIALVVEGVVIGPMFGAWAFLWFGGGLLAAVTGTTAVVRWHRDELDRDA
jgi:hypothetical protein